MEKKLTKNIFLGANTSNGFVHYFDDIVDMYDLEKLYIIKGPSGCGKSTFIRNIDVSFPDTDKTIIRCGSDPKSLDGIVLEELKLGVIDGTPPHEVNPQQFPSNIAKNLDFNRFLKGSTIYTPNSEIIKDLTEQKKRHYGCAYEALAKAREAHLEIEKYNGQTVDFPALTEFNKDFIAELRKEI